MLSAAPRLGRLCLRWPGLVVFAVALPALVFTIGAASMYALADPPLAEQGDWAPGGAANVEVQGLTSPLSLKKGQSVRYQIRLSHAPLEDFNEGKWWVRIHVNGAVRSDGYYPPGERKDSAVSWIPSVGYEFNRFNYNQPRTITFTAHKDLTETLTITHEVWATTDWCPRHNREPLTVSVGGGNNGNNDDTTTPNDDGGGTNTEGDIDPANGGGTNTEGDIDPANGGGTNTGGEIDPNNGDGNNGDGNGGGGNNGDGTNEDGSNGDGSNGDGTNGGGKNEGGNNSNEGNGGNGGGDGTDGNGGGDGGNGDNGGNGDGDGNGGASSLPTLSISDAQAAEGGTAQFAIALSAASQQAVTVSYRTADGTARAGTDYNAASGTLTFEPGDTTMSIPVHTLADDLDEPDETFTVRLSSPVNTTLQRETATGTITDTNREPALRISDAHAIEGGTVSASRLSAGIQG